MWHTGSQIAVPIASLCNGPTGIFFNKNNPCNIIAIEFSMDICMHALKYRVWWVESSLGKWYWHESFLSRYFEPCGNLKLQACNLQWSTQYTQLPLDDSYQVIFNVISSHFACYTELSFSHLFFQFNIFRSIYQFIYQLVKLWWSNSLQMDASLTLMSTEKYIMWMKWNIKLGILIFLLLDYRCYNTTWSCCLSLSRKHRF